MYRLLCPSLAASKIFHSIRPGESALIRKVPSVWCLWLFSFWSVLQRRIYPIWNTANILGPRQGNTLNRWPVHQRANTEILTHSFLHAFYCLQPNLSVFQGNRSTWRKTIAKEGENASSIEKHPSLVSHKGPSCCDATVLPTKPPCPPKIQHLVCQGSL